MVLVSVEACERSAFMEMALRHFRELNPNFDPGADWTSCYFEKIQQTAGFSLCWIVVDGERAGFILFGIEEHRFLPRKTGLIYELYVVPGQRRKGIAKASAAAAIRKLWTFSPSKIQLEVVEGNAAAARLWKALGFSKVSERLVLSRQDVQ
jgi:ribosomal protein S18 acetylase RimI-like enzyme